MRPLAFAVGDGIADLPLLDLAALAATPHHSHLEAPPRVFVTRGSYQAGLTDATTRLLGHEPGSCPVCAVDRSSRSLALLGLLSVFEAGPSRFPERVARAALAAAGFVRDTRRGSAP